MFFGCKITPSMCNLFARWIFYLFFSVFYSLYSGFIKLVNPFFRFNLRAVLSCLTDFCRLITYCKSFFSLKLFHHFKIIASAKIQLFKIITTINFSSFQDYRAFLRPYWLLEYLVRVIRVQQRFLNSLIRESMMRQGLTH